MSIRKKSSFFCYSNQKIRSCFLFACLFALLIISQLRTSAYFEEIFSNYCDLMGFFGQSLNVNKKTEKKIKSLLKPQLPFAKMYLLIKGQGQKNMTWPALWFERGNWTTKLNTGINRLQWELKKSQMWGYTRHSWVSWEFSLKHTQILPLSPLGCVCTSQTQPSLLRVWPHPLPSVGFFHSLDDHVQRVLRFPRCWTVDVQRQRAVTPLRTLAAK